MSNDELNLDPEWVEYINRYEKLIDKIVAKQTTDEALREDCAQEARIALLKVDPSQLWSYNDYMAGDISEEEWDIQLKRYCGNVIRNTVVDYLRSYKTGNWYIGRTRKLWDAETETRKRIHFRPRFSSMDELVDLFGMQVSETGDISWPEVSMDGLLKEEETNE